MLLHQLKLTHFKNYSTQVVDFSVRLNCIVGKNGMGKTNLLDAIYYLCMCKNNVGLNDRNVIQHEADFFRLEGSFERDEKKEKVVAKVIPGKRKEFERNGVPYAKLTEHIGLLPVVIIIPDDTALVTEGSELRRRFIDNTLSQLDQKYLLHLVAYNRLLKQRNATLKQFAKDRVFDLNLLRVFDQQMLEPAKVISAHRQAFLAKFTPIFEQYYQVISGEQEQVRCAYRSSLLDGDLGQLLEEATEKDRILQRTTVGVHRDDLQFFINDFPLKKFASQGQLKSFVLALKLAQYEILRQEKNTHPLLLLDDLFDKLDRHRVEHLIGLLLGNGFGQVFITDTHENRIQEIIEKFDSEYKKFVIENGTILSET